MKRPPRRLGVAVILAVVVAVVTTSIGEAPAVAADRPVTPRFGPVPEALGSFVRVHPGTPQEPGSAAVNSRLVFAARSEAHGDEVWVTDGTPDGTRLLADIVPGGSSSRPRSFVAFRGLVWFSAYRLDVGEEWWVTDGTPEGTRLFADLNPQTRPTEPRAPVVVGDRLYFAGRTVAAGYEVMVTDGTVAGTRVAVDTLPGPDSSFPRGLTAMGSRVIYGANVAPGSPNRS